jgi:histidinol dehydrogenase
MIVSVTIPLLNSSEPSFAAALTRLLDRRQITDPKITAVVADILADVRGRGDAAVLEYTRRFDNHPATAMAELDVTPTRCQAALAVIPAEQRAALETAAARVRDYHERQKTESWQYRDNDGTLLGQQVTSLDRANRHDRARTERRAERHGAGGRRHRRRRSHRHGRRGASGGGTRVRH